VFVSLPVKLASNSLCLMYCGELLIFTIEVIITVMIKITNNNNNNNNNNNDGSMVRQEFGVWHKSARLACSGRPAPRGQMESSACVLPLGLSTNHRNPWRVSQAQ